jgi:hypothetical protein
LGATDLISRGRDTCLAATGFAKSDLDEIAIRWLYEEHLWQAALGLFGEKAGKNFGRNNVT